MAPPDTFQYDRSIRCTGGPEPGTMALYNYVTSVFDVTTFGADDELIDHPEDVDVGRLGVYNCRKVRGGSSLSEHAEGRAMDLALNAFDPEDLEVGNRLIEIFEIEAFGLGIQSIVWNGRVWGYSRGTYWRALSRSANQHTDHIHVGMNRWGARNLTPQRVASILTKYTDLEGDDVGQRWMFRVAPLANTPPGRDAGYIAEVGKPLVPVNGAPELPGIIGKVSVAEPPLLWTEVGTDLLQYDFRNLNEVRWLESEETESLRRAVQQGSTKLTTETLRRALDGAQIRFD